VPLQRVKFLQIDCSVHFQLDKVVPSPLKLTRDDLKRRRRISALTVRLNRLKSGTNYFNSSFLSIELTV
jgi:hypothetical protein